MTQDLLLTAKKMRLIMTDGNKTVSNMLKVSYALGAMLSALPTLSQEPQCPFNGTTTAVPTLQ